MFRTALVTTLATAVLAGPASAGIIPIKETVTPDGADFRWTYGMALPSLTALKAGDYFTIYSVGGLVPGTIFQPSGWTETTQDVGITPPGIVGHNRPGVPNITYTYTGPTETVGQTGLGNFGFDSVYGRADGVRSVIAGHTQRSEGGVYDDNITPTLVPAATPEPGTLLLAALGLPAAALLRRLRRRV